MLRDAHRGRVEAGGGRGGGRGVRPGRGFTSPRKGGSFACRTRRLLGAGGGAGAARGVPRPAVRGEARLLVARTKGCAPHATPLSPCRGSRSDAPFPESAVWDTLRPRLLPTPSLRVGCATLASGSPGAFSWLGTPVRLGLWHFSPVGGDARRTLRLPAPPPSYLGESVSRSGPQRRRRRRRAPECLGWQSGRAEVSRRSQIRLKINWRNGSSSP